MSLIAFTNGTAILPDSLLPAATIVCRDGKIESVGKGGKRLPKGAPTEREICCFL